MKRSKTTTKFIIISTVLALVSMLIIGSALANPEDLNGQVLPDFSVDTINNTTFTLSESLKTHDLVLINFWATWCGPCRMEFPGLEMAWEQYSDRVDVIALSIEKTDTFDKLTEFASENNFEFLIGRDDPQMFDSMGGTAIPTTIIVDKDRRVVAIEIGAKTSAEDFSSLFDSLLNTSEDSAGDVVDQPVETANPEENTWVCSICHALNSNDDAFCTNCSQSRRCPKCGSSVPLDDRYCSICGEEVEGWKKPDSREVLDTEEACDCNCR